MECPLLTNRSHTEVHGGIFQHKMRVDAKTVQCWAGNENADTGKETTIQNGYISFEMPNPFSHARSSSQ